jgi:hypothetical protein
VLISSTDSNGSFMENGVVNNGVVESYALDKGNVDKLWQLSEKLVGQSFAA